MRYFSKKLNQCFLSNRISNWNTIPRKISETLFTRMTIKDIIEKVILSEKMELQYLRN